LRDADGLATAFLGLGVRGLAPIVRGRRPEPPEDALDFRREESLDEVRTTA
jgi:hypothetical protein